MYVLRPESIVMREGSNEQLITLSEVDDNPHGCSPSILRRAIWIQRWKIVVATLSCALLFALAGELVTPKFRASVTVLPLSATNTGGLGKLGSMGSMLGGIGSLVGLSSLGNAFKEEAVATLKSNRIAAQYIQQHNLGPVLFPKRWHVNTRALGPGGKPISMMWKAVRLFRKRIRSVERDRQTGIITLTVRWTNPKLAAQWANGLVSLTNQYLRSRAINMAEMHISFLQAQLEKTHQISLRQDIYSLMESELEHEMIARGRREYALRVIDPAMVPQKPYTPSLLELFFLGLGCGFLGSGYWAIRCSRNQIRRKMN